MRYRTLIQEQNYSFLFTGIPIYWSTDSNKTPNFLDFLVINGISSMYVNVIPNYDFPFHTLIISSFINKQRLNCTRGKIRIGTITDTKFL